MSQRSPYNDRYKVEQKGKTRKSASAARPSRAVGELGTPTKKKTRSTAWGRAKAASKSSSSRSRSAAAPELPPSPRMVQLRKYWWIAWITALVVAIVILIIQSIATSALGKILEPYQPIGWGLWLVAMGIAFYLEFVPIKRERAAIAEAAKSGKSAKTEQPVSKSSASSKPETSDNEQLGLGGDYGEDDE